MVELLNEESDPFNVLVYDSLFFDAEKETSLLRTVLEKTSQSIKRLEQKKEDRLIQPPKLEYPLQYLSRFLIGSGRLMLFSAEITSPFTTFVEEKNPFFNLEVSNILLTFRRYQRTINIFYKDSQAIFQLIYSCLADTGL